MRALDLFCCGGGASKGLAEAGFDVVGVDLRPVREYPFLCIRGCAIRYLDAYLRGDRPHGTFDLIWASPPCQGFSAATPTRFRGQYKDLIVPTRNRLKRTGALWIIENVPGAPLRRPITLCGAMFGLGVIRHRLFETNWYIRQPQHPDHAGSIVTGEYVTVAGNGGVPAWTVAEREKRGLGRYFEGEMTLARWQEAMGIDWLPKKPLVQAIPPAYARFLGSQARAELLRSRLRRVAALRSPLA